MWRGWDSRALYPGPLGHATIAAMLIPRFSMRWMLGAVTVAGFISLLLSLAVRGQAWAQAVTIALASLLIAFWLYGALFLLTYVFTGLRGLVARKEQPRAPFAQFTPAPQQIVAPDELE